MSATDALVLAGAAAVVAGTVAAGFPRLSRTGLAAQSVGVALLGAAGGWVLASGHPVGAGFRGDVHLAFGIDGLSGFFLLVVAVVGAPAALFARDALRTDGQGRSLAVATGVFLLALVGFVCARDVSDVPGVLGADDAGAGGRDPGGTAGREARRGVFVYLAITHLGRRGVWVSMLVLAQHGALGGHAAGRRPGGVRGVARRWSGSATKAGLMPLHSWLPRAHPLAPAHVSALMSGVMIKLALYGLMRVLFQWLAPRRCGSGSRCWRSGRCRALGGVLYALMQHELKRLLAFHSIENVGIVALGLGASLVFARYRAADMERDRVRGGAAAHAQPRAVQGAAVPRRRSRSARPSASSSSTGSAACCGGCRGRAATFAVGAMAIAGLPPLNGFVSEWLTLQSLLHLGVYEPSRGRARRGARDSGARRRPRRWRCSAS